MGRYKLFSDITFYVSVRSKTIHAIGNGLFFCYYRITTFCEKF